MTAILFILKGDNMNTLKSCPLMEPNFWEEMSCNSHNVVADCPHRKPNSDLENSRWTCASCGAKYSHNHKRVTVQRECGTVTVCCACEGAEMEKDIEIERLKIALEAVKTPTVLNEHSKSPVKP